MYIWHGQELYVDASKVITAIQRILCITTSRGRTRQTHRKPKLSKLRRPFLTQGRFYPESSLADLYDELTMPPELRKAHQNNDRAVMQAYGLSVKDTTESSCVAELMKLYQAKTAGK